ncbi:MAG TPA: OmpA family protein [Polyangiaceae bacterium]|nr:OmpA family protein [Polyangiaceae bacterium]
MNNLRCFVRVVVPAVIALGVSACEGEQQAHAVTPAAASVQPSETAQEPIATPNAPTATSVQISKDILRACNIPDADAYFMFDSSKLTPFDGAPLDAVARCFSHGPLAGRQMQLVGHADPRGASDYNMALGQSRADAVATYLESRGLQHTTISTTSRGAMDATGREETGWAHDRRVDVLLGG